MFQLLCVLLLITKCINGLDNLEPKTEIASINPDLLSKWKLFMNDLKEHKKSLFTMPKDLKKYIIEMQEPSEFVNLIFKGLDPPLNDYIHPSSETFTLGWNKFLEHLKKDFIANGEIMDGITFAVPFSFYLQLVSNNTRYIQAVNYIYQMDSSVKTELEEFREKMLNDYNVTISSLSKKLLRYFLKFENPADLFRSILSAYTDNFKMKDASIQMELAKKYQDSLGNTIMFFNKTFFYGLFPELQFIIKYYTMGTLLESQVDEVLKMNERNALVKKTEYFWHFAKSQPKVKDGLEVFLQVLEDLGEYYSKTEELCEERSRIMEVLDKVKVGFAAKSECTVNKLLTKFKNEL